MHLIAVYVFWCSALVILYVLFGYPLLLGLLSLGKGRAIQKAPLSKTVSVIIPVHNGEPWIQQKLESLAQLSYPRDLMEIILIDDGSTDRTAELIKASRDSRVRQLSLTRSGKASALNAGINCAHGEVLLFTDIRQRLDPESLRLLVECLADPSVGVVSGELVILSGQTQAESDI